MSYELIDRFLRNNLGDDDYAEYSEALDSICPREWQGLTDDDVHELTKDVIAFKSDVVKFIREAEAKLREKNT